MSFIRVFTHKPSGRQYLYEEVRQREGDQMLSFSRSLGRVGWGFFFWLGVLVDNLAEGWLDPADEFEALNAQAERDLADRKAAEDRLAEVVNPTTYDEPDEPPEEIEQSAPEGEPGDAPDPDAGEE